jgi:hypothetical protein
VAGTDAGSVIAVEVFIKQNVVSPLGIGLKLLRFSIYRPAARAIAQEDTDQPLAELMCYFK